MAGKPFDSWLKRQSVETRSPTRLLLASASPRRREILESLGVEFDVVVPRVEELTEGDPDAVVLENARRKATAGFANAPQGAVALGVDTEVVLDGRVLGKALGPAEARERLEALSERTHVVLGGMVALGPKQATAGSGSRGQDPAERSGIARSEVTFRRLDSSTLEAYLASGEWRDRAGAYAIQGLGSILVDRVAGDFSNVVGLPVRLLMELVPEPFATARDSHHHSAGRSPGMGVAKTNP
jgi:septum formation protein